jgi:predicted metal-dependent HD superfamily phosphohydrolase
MDVKAVSDYLIHRLRHELKQALSYHSVEHTIDVIEATNRLAISEKLTPHETKILETAALFHDSGMLVQYKDHESASVAIANEVLPRFGYHQSEIELIANLITVTKLPQRPYNHLEQIICDADLDYLGRDDFFIHSFKLRLEWQVNEIRNTSLPEWFDIQINFLSQHQYFTKTAIALRNDKKLRNLEEIRELVVRGEG